MTYHHQSLRFRVFFFCVRSILNARDCEPHKAAGPGPQSFHSQFIHYLICINSVPWKLPSDCNGAALVSDAGARTPPNLALLLAERCVRSGAAAAATQHAPLIQQLTGAEGRVQPPLTVLIKCSADYWRGGRGPGGESFTADPDWN